MAECSFSRCIQQRRNIRRELQRWTKTMVHIVGLERIAEELMGRRKWKLYQESMSRSYLQPLNNNIKRTNEVDTDEYHHQKEAKSNRLQTQTPNTDSESDKDHSKQGGGKQEALNGTEGDRAKEEDREERQKENENDSDRLKDWTPPTKCHFCVDGKLDSEHTAHGVLSPRLSDSDTSDSHSDSEVPTSLLPTSRGLLNNHHRHRSNIQNPVPPPLAMTTIENNMIAAASLAAAISGGQSPVGAPNSILPFYNHPNLMTHDLFHLSNVVRTFQAAAALNEKSNGNTATGEQPLDLSKGAVNNQSAPQGADHRTEAGANLRLPTLEQRHIFNSDSRAKPRMSTVAGRRTYTEDELQAALRDIQSGKLGTRRAAVIYGIPRSTLRNKVYKLALERERESHLNSSTPLEDETMEDENNLSGTEEEKAVEKALQGPLVSLADIFRMTGRDIPEALKKSDEGQDAWGGLDYSEMAPYLNFLASQNMLSQKPADGPMVAGMIPELMKKMLDDHFKMQQNGDSDKIARPSPSNSVIIKHERTKSESDMETDDAPSNVILKIPSFRPTTSSKNGCDAIRSQIEPSDVIPAGSILSPPVTSESGSPPILPPKGLNIMKDVKDVIAQSISQKFHQPMEPRRPVIDIDFKRSGFTPPLGSGISVIKTQQDLSRQFQQQQQQQQSPKPPQSANSTPTGGKGTRPKRGKYRNYDRDSLVEAVRAVQRGEMSVHRAGSYYGVPHSTLEYKVKERHLMRPRKRDPKPNPVDEKIASLKQNDIRNSQEKMKSMMKPPQKFSPTSPNGMKLPLFESGISPLTGFNGPPFPFWAPAGFPPIPIDYARNQASSFPASPDFFASQMMQKLQEESSRAVPQQSPGGPTLSKNARQRAESLLETTAPNGSFLDGIIRSSLESGVPGSEDKSLNEDKNVAPENMSNKALLDQLCRNSRLPPLSKPPASEGTHSSEDESCRKSISPLNYTTAETSQDDNDDDSSSRFDKDGAEVQMIELSNDSNASSERKVNEEERRQPRLYVKQDLAKPENLKPEMLMRFPEVLADVDHNGLAESAPSSASDNDGPQD
ncbi:unnamed protein product [Phyllotreta striolata]|uniref:HTH psq-type domain-containing protein n=1 Tax=Phyllotreta striolata TaxID=444603 RepID=A0A9N9XPG5_PHYSR|nr:unnamed protein product [Phyllotreta striolata]